MITLDELIAVLFELRQRQPSAGTAQVLVLTDSNEDGFDGVDEVEPTAVTYEHGLVVI